MKSPSLVYAVTAWAMSEEELPSAQNAEDAREFTDIEEAKKWAWDRMEEGFYTCMFRR